MTTRAKVVLAAIGLMLGLAFAPLPHGMLGAQGAASFGAAPFAEVSRVATGIASDYAVNQPECGLTANQLTALSLAPTWAETTGGTLTVSPSPMTLGRSDVSSTLFPPAELGESGAFWHTSIGLWQLDSSGLGRTLHAGERIDSTAAGVTAIGEIARRWCNADADSLYGPWVACTVTDCLAVYEFLYDAMTDSLRNLELDESVTDSGGGIEWRTCILSVGSQVPCAYIDPQAAQGHKAFLVDDFGPSPLTTPFYAFKYFGEEVRVWLADDDPSADTDVVAVRLEFESAHNLVTWSTSFAGVAEFCDLDTRRGVCPSPCFGETPTVWNTFVRPTIDGVQSLNLVGGTAGDDVIRTGDGPDWILAGIGDDLICSGGGDDQVLGGSGNDQIDGFDGNDQLWGQGGDDHILGKFGDDKIRGGDGNDRLEGGPDVDDLNGGRDDDTVDGGGGDDIAVRGGTGDDTVLGGPGNDQLVNGNGGRDIVNGGDGDDVVIGGPRPDEVYGGGGNDIVRGLGGADLLSGGDGDDELFGGRQPDDLDGGPGADLCNGGSETDVAQATCESTVNVP